jgi:hypothetical protein
VEFTTVAACQRTPLASADVLVDQKDKIVKIFFPRTNMEVVREDLAKE